MKATIIYLLITCQLACLAQDDVAQRIDRITQYIMDDPQNARLFVKRATLYIEEDQYENAKADLAMATEIGGDDFQAAIYTYADLYRQLGNYETALKYIDDFLKVNPMHLRSFRLKAQILEYLGDLDGAIDYYKKVIVHTKLPQAENYIPIVNLLEKQGRYVEAIFYCQAATRQIGNLPEFEEKMAHLNHLKGD